MINQFYCINLNDLKIFFDFGKNLIDLITPFFSNLLDKKTTSLKMMFLKLI